MMIGRHDTDQKVVIVAEIGNNHEGSATLAQEMIGRAAEAGADAVKFQTFTPEHYVSSSDTQRFERLKKFQLSHDAFVGLAATARSCGVEFFSTPFDLASARFLAEVAPVFKIASGDNTFYPLLETVAQFGKPVILSCGLAALKEIHFAKMLIERVWAAQGLDPGFAALHCVSAYPTPLEQANLGAIPTLARTLGCTVGYSDHTLGIDAAVLSVAAGARIIEKHFTVNKNFSDFRDHQLSADPPEMKALVERVRSAETMMGTGVKITGEAEMANATAMRRSIAAARDLAAGTMLTLENITWIRSGGSLPPGSETAVLGRRLRRSVTAGTFLGLDLLE